MASSLKAWIVRGALTLTTFLCIWVMAFGTGADPALAFIGLVAAHYILIPLLEEVE